jgi:hypothetical protein
VSACGGPARYEIRVAGVLDSRWSAWFNGLQVSGRGEETVICGLDPAVRAEITNIGHVRSIFVIPGPGKPFELPLASRALPAEKPV